MVLNSKLKLALLIYNETSKIRESNKDQPLVPVRYAIRRTNFFQFSPRIIPCFPLLVFPSDGPED